MANNVTFKNKIMINKYPFLFEKHMKRVYLNRFIAVDLNRIVNVTLVTVYIFGTIQIFKRL